jgi:hypothetical protein
MPLQRRKKKKAPPKKAGGMSQVQNVKVVVNAAGTAPRRRRRAPAKKKDAGFSFGGGGAGLAQVVSAPSVTQDVLQQSQELRQTLQKLQAGPLRNNAVLGEIGQIERPLLPDDQPVSRGQLKFVVGSVIEQQSLQNQAMTQGFEQYRALAGKQLDVLESSIHSLSVQKPPEPAMARSESPVPLVPQPSPRGRSPTVREASTAAEAGSPPPPSRRPPARAPDVNDQIFQRHLARQPGESNADLARLAGISKATYEKIITAGRKKAGRS